MQEFWTWYFERHLNPLSWAIRPLFVLLFCYFSYKRKPLLAVFTIILTFTSAVWFPKPDIVNPMVQNFLQVEKEWLLGPWTYLKVFETMLIVIGLFSLGAAFWYRSIKIGLLVLGLVTIAKIAWSVFHGKGSSPVLIVFAVFTLLVSSAVIYIANRYFSRRKTV